MNTQTVPAAKVREGDFLPGLDNGYVYEDASGEDIPPYFDGRFAIARSGDNVRIGFHTAEGEEAELICPADMPITVERQ